VVAADPPDGLVIDTTGADHLHGGEEAMVKSMVDRLRATGFAGRAALADSWGAAHAFARYVARPVSIVPKGASATTVLNLPSQPFDCRKKCWRAFAFSASIASASWRTSRARR
jgi:protein ImuB